MNLNKTMSDKKEKDKLDLSFIDDVDDFIENDAPSEYSLKLSQAQQIKWLSMTPAERELFSKKIQDSISQFESPEQAKEIFGKCWGEDRGDLLYKKLSKEYGVSVNGIIDLVRGGYDVKTGTTRTHFLCPVDLDTLNQMKKEHAIKFSNVYKIKTKGKELLSEYDDLFFAGGSNADCNGWRKHFPPSFVFHCRFRLPNPTPESIREYCDSQGKPRIRNDLGIYKNILYGNPKPGIDWYTWMEDVDSQEIEFRNLTDALNWTNDFLGENYYTSISHIEQCWNKKMLWRTFSCGRSVPTAGWIFERFNYKGEKL